MSPTGSSVDWQSEKITLLINDLSRHTDGSIIKLRSLNRIHSPNSSLFTNISENMSARPSTTNLATEFADPAILEKIESQHTCGELTPVHNAIPVMNTDERLDDS